LWRIEVMQSRVPLSCETQRRVCGVQAGLTRVLPGDLSRAPLWARALGLDLGSPVPGGISLRGTTLPRVRARLAAVRSGPYTRGAAWMLPM